MKHRIRILSVCAMVLFVCLSACSDKPRENDTAIKLDGAWKVIETDNDAPC